jgi:hypothetical protein
MLTENDWLAWAVIALAFTTGAVLVWLPAGRASGWL